MRTDWDDEPEPMKPKTKKPKTRPLPASFEFPKMLFKDDGRTNAVANVPALEAALKDGWKERSR